MTQFLRRAGHHESRSYQAFYEFIGKPGSGFSFPCDEKGVVLPLSEASAENYRKCLDNSHISPVLYKGVQAFTSRYRVAAVIRCGCKAALELSDSMTNRCECGRLYNGSGQELCDPSLWGEETGERFDDAGRQIL